MRVYRLGKDFEYTRIQCDIEAKEGICAVEHGINISLLLYQQQFIIKILSLGPNYDAIKRPAAGLLIAGTCRNRIKLKNNRANLQISSETINNITAQVWNDQ